jgi:hypothetical protein
VPVERNRPLPVAISPTRFFTSAALSRIAVRASSPETGANNMPNPTPRPAPPRKLAVDDIQLLRPRSASLASCSRSVVSSKRVLIAWFASYARSRSSSFSVDHSFVLVRSRAHFMANRANFLQWLMFRKNARQSPLKGFSLLSILTESINRYPSTCVVRLGNPCTSFFHGSTGLLARVAIAQ